MITRTASLLTMEVTVRIPSRSRLFT